MPLAKNLDKNGRIAALLNDVADGLGRLMSEHIALARAELGQEASAVGRSLAQVAAFLSLALLGYGFSCAALVAYLASQWRSAAAALLLVGGGNLVAGAIGAFLAVRRMSARRVMRETLDQLDRSAAALLPGVTGENTKVADEARP